MEQPATLALTPMDFPMPRNPTEWLLSLTLFVLLADRLFAFWKNHLREQPRPAETYATKPELAAAEKSCAERAEVSRQRLDRHGQYLATKDEVAAVVKDVEEWKKEIRKNGEQRKSDIEKKVETAFGQCQDRINKVEADLKTGFDGLNSRLTNMATSLTKEVGELTGEIRAERNRKS